MAPPVEPTAPRPSRAPSTAVDAAAPDVPDPSKAGASKAFALDFEGIAAGASLPAGLLGLDGRWGVVPDASAKAGAVLRQDRTVPTYAVVLVTGEGRAWRDGKASVRFRPESGDEDASGGIVFRARDGANYGLVRANSLEGNLRIYAIRDGLRRQIASRDVEAPRLGAWHVLEVTFVGSTVVATLDGTDRIEASHDGLVAGWCGLWTKADAVTSFDDFRIEPVTPKADAKPAPPPEPAPPRPAAPKREVGPPR